MERGYAGARFAVGALLFAACTYDFGAFDFRSGTASSSTGQGGFAGIGAVGGAGGIGGTGASGGVAGMPAGTGGLSGSSSTTAAGAAGCGATGKVCGTSCVSIDDPAFGCAAPACDPCALPNATASCSGGACAVGACAAGFGDCDGVATNGCETHIDADPFNCGGCARACAAAHTASIACQGGACTSTCDLGWANCALPAAPAPDDGCELDVGHDDTSCGGCTNACSLQGNVAAANALVCDGGGRPKNHCGCSGGKRCRIGNATGQCDVTTGRCSCGGITCAEGEACVATGAQSVCSCNGGTACPSGQACCQTPSGCVNLAADASNCGACGHACPPNFGCSSGSCGCTTNESCNAGTPGAFACLGAACACGGQTCAVGERCQPDGNCG